MSPRRWLARILPDDDWSREFLEALDREAAARPGRGARRVVWWRAILSYRTWQFVWLVRRRRRVARSEEGRMGRGLDGWLKDLSHAMRVVRRERRFTFFVALTLALGIAGTAAMFGIADRLFLRGPEHVEDPERLVRFYLEFEAEGGAPARMTPWIPWLTGQGMAAELEAVDGLTQYRLQPTLSALGDEVRRLEVSTVGLSYFAVLGTTPVAGRFFGPGDEADRASAVVSSELAEAAWGGTDAALGRTLTVEDRSVTVIGVAPPGFTGPHLGRIDAWVPLEPDEAGTRNWMILARLPAHRAPGAARPRATADAQAIHRRTDPGRSFQWATEGAVSAAPLSHDDAGVEPAELSVARLLIAVVLMTLLIAGVNVVNLLLARVTRRGHEIAVRLGLGASRGRILRLLLTESVVLAGVGALVGLPILWALATTLRRVLLPGVAWPAAPLAPRVLLATLGVTLLTGLLAGLIPARRAAAMDPRRSLRSEGGGGTTRGRLRVHVLLATAQVTLATALLAGAGLFVKSFWNLHATDLGYDARRVTAFELGSLDRAAFAGSPEGDGPIYREALQMVRADPAVSGATLAVGLPLTGSFGLGVSVPGLDSVPALPGGGPWLTAVDAGYFATLGTEIVAGRAFSPAEVDGLEQVVIVSEAMAAALWPPGGALGACLHIRFEGDPCFRVVGVAEDVKRAGYREPPSMQYYVPLGHERGSFGGTRLAVRTTADPGVLDRLRTRLVGLDPRVDYVEVTSLAGILEPEIRPWRLGAIVLGLAAALATLVSVLGVYGVLSYLVAQRRRELGVRIALGASGASVQGLVLRRGAAAASLGVAAGLTVVALASGWLEPLLFETSATDPLVLGTVAALLLTAALAACALPARQASRVEPVSCLKGE